MMAAKQTCRTRPEARVYQWVSAFEDVWQRGEKITPEEFLKEVPESAGLDRMLLRKYLETSRRLLEAGQAELARAPKLSAADWAKIRKRLSRTRGVCHRKTK